MKSFFVLVALLACAINVCGKSLDVWQESKWPLSSGSKWVKSGKEKILEVTNDKPGEGVLNTCELDVLKYPGYGVRATVEIKAENVTAPTIGYLGVKFMMPYDYNGMTTWLSATDGLHGSFDWKKFTLQMTVIPGVNRVTVQLGLQNSVGKVSFRNLKVELIPPNEMRPMPYELPKNFKCEYSPEIKNRPVRRGAMMNDPRCLNPKDIEDLAAMGGNLIRWQFHPGSVNDFAVYERSVDESIDKLLAFSPLLEKLDVMVVFDMHEMPGGRLANPPILGTAGSLAQLDGSSCLRVFVEDICLNEYVKVWRHIAERLKDSKVIWGYDLMNEPTQGGQDVKYHYLLAQYHAAKAIREVDPETPIIVEADEWANPTSFAYLEPLPLKNVIYSFHFYMPGEYTHQGTAESTMEPVRQGKMRKYPDATTNANVLYKGVVPIINFAKKYNAIIFCGEFSVIRWAPGAGLWLRDTVAAFEKAGFNWTYHAFREWHGWSFEHDEDWRNNDPVNYDTERKKVILNAWKKNKKGATSEK